MLWTAEILKTCKCPMVTQCFPFSLNRSRVTPHLLTLLFLCILWESCLSKVYSCMRRHFPSSQVTVRTQRISKGAHQLGSRVKGTEFAFGRMPGYILSKLDNSLATRAESHVQWGKRTEPQKALSPLNCSGIKNWCSSSSSGSQPQDSSKPCLPWVSNLSTTHLFLSVALFYQIWVLPSVDGDSLYFVTVLRSPGLYSLQLKSALSYLWSCPKSWAKGDNLGEALDKGTEKETWQADSSGRLQ